MTLAELHRHANGDEASFHKLRINDSARQMLLYHNKSLFALSLTRLGSVFYRWDSILWGLVIAGMGCGVQYWLDSGDLDSAIQNQYGFQAFGVGLTFCIVFRAQNAWNRYWEAVTQLHFMYSKWTDAFSLFQAFAEVTKMAAEKSNNESKIDYLLEKQRKLRATFALLSAVAVDRLSKGDTSMMDSASCGVKSRGQLRVQRQHMTYELNLIPTHLFDRACAPSGQSGYVVPELPCDERKKILENAHDATTLAMYWILSELADAMEMIDIATPIQSRLYQELSSGMLGFNNCLKIADVPYPLPFAQLLGLLLAAFSCFIPVYVILFTRSPIAGPILCLLLFESLWCLSEVAKELENPFGDDANDIPLTEFHLRFVDTLEDVSKAGQNSLLRKQLMGLHGSDIDDTHPLVETDADSSDSSDASDSSDDISRRTISV